MISYNMIKLVYNLKTCILSHEIKLTQYFIQYLSDLVNLVHMK